VVLFADDAAIDFVRILLFKDFAQLADQKQLETRSLPPVTTEDPQTSILSAPTPPVTPPATPPAAAAAPTASLPKPVAPKPPAPKPAAPKPATTPAATGAPR
jgi:rod shape-determining protein MreC